MNTFFELLLKPLAALPPAVGLVVVSVLFGIILVPIYGKLSPQNSIRNAKRGITAALFESILFRSNIAITLGAQGRMLLGGVKYFLCAIPPILLLMIPMVLLLAQLNLYYGSRPLKGGESVIVKVGLDSLSNSGTPTLKSEPSLSITPPVRVAAGSEVYWRVDLPKGFAAEKVRLTYADSKGATEKDLYVGNRIERISALESQNFWDRLLYPGSINLSPGVHDLSVSYPARSLSILGFESSWVVHFFIISILTGLIASKFFGVEV